VRSWRRHHGRQLARQRRTAEGCGQEAGQRDAHLYRRKEAVGIGVELGDDRPAPAARGERPDLAVAQGHQRDLRRGKDATYEDEDDDQGDFADGAAHRTSVLAPPGWQV